MSGREAADEYMRAIEDEFVHRRGSAMLLSPRDWSLMGEWYEAGIPLRVVLQGINNVFDAHARRAPEYRRINSLSYCRQEVLSLHDLYRGMRGAEAGRPDPGEQQSFDPRRAIGRHLGRLSRSLRLSMVAASEAGQDALVGALATALAELKLLRRDLKKEGFDPQILDESLGRIDRGVLDAARAACPSDVVETAVSGARAELAGRRAGMTDEAYRATVAALVDRALRVHCGVPRLTIFE